MKTQAEIDNPQFVTVTLILNVYHIEKREWDTRQDGYVVTISKQMDPKLSPGEVYRQAVEWAESEGIEYR